MYRFTLKHRATNHIHRKTWRNGIETHHREDNKRSQSSSILISGDTHQVVSKPLCQQTTHTFLSTPWFAYIIIEVRNMHSRFVSHRELSHIARMITKLMVEIGSSFSQRSIKHTFQLLYELFFTSYHLYQIANIMRNIPTINPTVILIISIACTYTT